MNIRIAELKDLESIVGIYNQAIIAGEKTGDVSAVTVDDRRKWFEEHQPHRYPIFVAEKKGAIIGYLSISPYRPGRMALRHTGEVSYYVHFYHHHKGVASSLIQYAIKFCPTVKIKTLLAIVIDSNKESISFLDKFDFNKWGHLPEVAEFGETTVGHLYYGLKIGE